MRKLIPAAIVLGSAATLIAQAASAQYPGGPYNTALGPAAYKGAKEPEEVPWVPPGGQAPSQGAAATSGNQTSSTGSAAPAQSSAPASR